MRYPIPPAATTDHEGKIKLAEGGSFKGKKNHFITIPVTSGVPTIFTRLHVKSCRRLMPISGNETLSYHGFVLWRRGRANV